jgi:hypothetical protein
MCDEEGTFVATSEYGEGLPAFDAPRELVPPRVLEAVEPYDHINRRAVEWAAAIQTTFEREEMYVRFPAYQFASYGALDPEVDGGAFGVAVHALAPYQGSLDHGMAVGNARFRIAVRTDEQLTLHRPPDPANGTATCWAHSAKLTPGHEYVLTVEHAVSGHSVGVGGRVPMSHGTATIVDLPSYGIDAALLDTGTSGSLTQLPAVRYPAPWTPVTIEGAHCTPSTTFMRSSDVTGSLHPMLPIRLFFAHAAHHGDSGALVLDQNGRGLGLYMGEVTNRGGVREGVCQHLGQVEQVMALTLLR